MKTNYDSFFAESVDPKQEARFLALEVTCRLLVWMAEAASLDERGVRATVALYSRGKRRGLKHRATPGVRPVFK